MGSDSKRNLDIEEFHFFIYENSTNKLLYLHSIILLLEFQPLISRCEPPGSILLACGSHFLNDNINYLFSQSKNERILPAANSRLYPSFSCRTGEPHAPPCRPVRNILYIHLYSSVSVFLPSTVSPNFTYVLLFFTYKN